MSEEKAARDIASTEYDKFMDKYKAHVEGGNMKLMQHMLRLEADKIRTQSIVDAIDKSQASAGDNIYGDTKMKMQMSEDEYNIDQGIKKVDKVVDERERAFIKMATSPIKIGDPDKMDTFKVKSPEIGQLDPFEPIKEVTQKPRQQPVIEVDPKTGRKVYKGPKLRSRKIEDGKVWDNQHPNFHDKGVGGI